MYFKISTREPDPDFSWIIVKNPDSVFDNTFGNTKNARRVTAKFVETTHCYEGRVQNNWHDFLAMLRHKNVGNYVHAQFECVCPWNLKGFDVVFHTALRGKNAPSSPLTPERFSAAKLFTATLGPFPCPREKLIDVFGDVGIRSTIHNDGTSAAFMATLENIEPMSTTEFLQKLYIVSTYLTLKYSLETWISEEQLNKLIELSRGWLSLTPHRNAIIAAICRKNTSMLRYVEDRLAEPSESVAPEEEPAPELEEPAVASHEKRISLHEARHRLILNNIPKDAERIIDIGCAGGSLLIALAKAHPTATVIGVDANHSVLVRIKRRLSDMPNVKLIHSNILFPELTDDMLKPDVVILTEVIEHLEEGDRRRLLEIICDGICPKEFILTTPNVEYNPRIVGLKPGQYRHEDHRIEYTRAQFETEVIKSLRAKYEITELLVKPEEDIQPSFVIHCRLRAAAPAVREDIWQTVRVMHEGLYVAETNYTVTRDMIRFGATSFPFLTNADKIFYLGPTISPVDHDRAFPEHLEYPSACFAYYQKHGIDRLIEEPKYMGSRAHILIFRDPNHAKLFGYALPIVMIAKTGNPFTHSNETLMRIYEDIRGNMTDDFVMLDAEVLPWSLKSGPTFMNRDFRIPGEAALLTRTYGGSGSLKNAQDFLQVFERFAASQDLEIRPFHILAQGRVHVRGHNATFQDVRMGFYRSHPDQLRDLERLTTGTTIFKPCAWHEVDLTSPSSMSASIERWEHFCDVIGGEGFVYKPMNFVSYGENGYMRQPAIKVRGRDYLRIIYGIDYLEPKNFTQFQQRNTGRKRQMAIQEQELAIRILRTFLKRNRTEHQKSVAAFLGVDNVNMNGIDRTL